MKSKGICHSLVDTYYITNKTYSFIELRVRRYSCMVVSAGMGQDLFLKCDDPFFFIIIIEHVSEI